MNERLLVTLARQCRNCLRVHYGPHACPRAEAGAVPVGWTPGDPYMPAAAEADVYELAAELRAKYPGSRSEIEISQTLAEFTRAMEAGGWISGAAARSVETIPCPYGCGQGFLLYDDGRDPLKDHVDYCRMRPDDEEDYE